jgi:hypothetical protein
VRPRPAPSAPHGSDDQKDLAGSLSQPTTLALSAAFGGLFVFLAGKIAGIVTKQASSPLVISTAVLTLITSGLLLSGGLTGKLRGRINWYALVVAVSASASVCLAAVSLAGTTRRDCISGYSPCIQPGLEKLHCENIPESWKPIRVTGKDPYRLDANNDGFGCQ